MSVPLALPPTLGKLSAGDTVGVQVMYSPDYIQEVIRDRPWHLSPTAPFGSPELVNVPLISNRLELTVDEAMLRERTATARQERPRVEYAYGLWGWTPIYADMAKFRKRIDEARAAGFNTIELTVSWKDVEPEARGRFDWARTDERIDYVLGRGMGLRVRLNFAHAQPWPAWAQPEMSQIIGGKPGLGLMTLFDPALGELEAAAAEVVAARYQGRGIEWCPVIGVHTEVKFGAWLGYEPAGRAAFRRWLEKRYKTPAALAAAWGKTVAAWDEVQPPFPAPTGKEPDVSAESCDWIAFREEALAERMALLLAAVRKGDPGAITSVMLGESFRRESAEMANLAYLPYSRAADRVIHSYDFFWHGPKESQAAGTAVDIMRGITGKPVVFEIDGPILQERFGYTDADLAAIGRLALERGAAGINVANYCYDDRPLSDFPFLATLGRETAERNARPPQALPPATHLYYVSKWANYAFRDPRAEWVHDRQFAPYAKLRAEGVAARVVTDENLLAEDFAGATHLHVAPVLVIEARAAARLRELAQKLKTDPPDPLAGAVILKR